MSGARDGLQEGARGFGGGMRALVAGLVAVLVLSACGSGSGSGVSAGTYMQSVCKALRPWDADLTARSNALSPTTTATAAKRKQLVKQFLAAVIADTNAAEMSLQKAGTPKVPNGPKLAGDLVGAFNQLKTTYVRASQQAAKLPTTNVQTLQGAILSIATTIDNSLQTIGTRLGALKTPELKAAAAKAPACAKLSNG
jgi:hypothetical protein